MPTYADVDLDAWEVLGVEPMGSKPNKIWVRDPSAAATDPDRSWLFKPTTIQHEHDRQYLKGDDWAERIAAEVAHALGVPAAPVELARRRDIPGIVSGNVSAGRDLVLGNVVLFGQDPDYDLDRRRGVPGYTVEAVFAALTTLEVAPPGANVVDACSAFATYLLLDALVANTDRHHENWGLLLDPTGTTMPQLAPTFDHASCLGFQLSDDERRERLGTRDAGRNVSAFAHRGRSRHFADSLGLVDLALEAMAQCGQNLRDLSRSALELLDDVRLEALVAAVPEARMKLL